MMRVKLADPSHILPLPDRPGQSLAGDAVIEINPASPTWAALLRDGSVIDAGPDASPAALAAPETTSKKEAR
jgi:hypothetical protein